MTETDEGVAGVAQRPGTETKSVTVSHPSGGESQTVAIPANHDGSQIKVEFPDGAVSYIEGFDPAERARSGERAVIPCANCGAEVALTGTSLVCSACGTEQKVELRTAGDTGTGTTTSAEG